MEEMKKDICTEWETTDMGEPTKIIGIKITQSLGQISISQGKSIENILKQQGLIDANPAKMPLDPNIKIEPNPDRNEGDRSNTYAQLIGKLQFIANSTWPDIMYAINRLASYITNPSMQHQTAVKRVLQYLSGTKTYGITYENIPGSYISFLGYANAAYKNRDDNKSTTGYVFIAAGGAITWQSSRQSVTAESSTEAEYITLWEARKKASWLRNLYNKLGFTQKEPTVIMQDNTRMVAIVKNPMFHKCTKHINSHFHWIREKIQDG